MMVCASKHKTIDILKLTLQQRTINLRSHRQKADPDHLFLPDTYKDIYKYYARHNNICLISFLEFYLFYFCSKFLTST